VLIKKNFLISKQYKLFKGDNTRTLEFFYPDVTRDSRSASPVVDVVKPLHERPSSPLTDAQPRPMSCILQPPLPDPAAAREETWTETGTGSEPSEKKPADALTTVPILLNPDILQHTAVPIISPQVKIYRA
jgi:hypothetical protein